MSLIGRKYIIGASRLFLYIFLVVHLSANLVLLLPEVRSRQLYNAYASFLATNPMIKFIAYLLYASILAHLVFSTITVFRNKQLRTPRYAINRSSENSTWPSQHMGLLGMFIFIFIVVHLANFWARAKLGLGEEVPKDPWGNKDLYLLADHLFSNIYYVVFYALLMIPLGFHLFHGFTSAFRSLGFYHRRGLRVIEKVSVAFTAIITIGFFIIPIVMYLK